MLIQVDLTGLPVVRDPHREGNGPVYAEHAYATPENVEPSRLTVLAVINSEV